jgi:hypothetical protein
MKSCSLSLRSSKRISLQPAAALAAVGLDDALGLLVRQLVGRHVVGVVHAPMMIGLSGLPSRKSTTTSWPTRGRNIMPYCPPARPWLTRIQQDESAP